MPKQPPNLQGGRPQKRVLASSSGDHPEIHIHLQMTMHRTDEAFVLAPIAEKERIIDEDNVALVEANSGLKSISIMIEDLLRERGDPGWAGVDWRSPRQLFAGDQEFIFGGITIEKNEDVGVFVRWQNSSNQLYPTLSDYLEEEGIEEL